MLYSAILSEQTITILEGILDFKKSIDKNFPGLSDIIIAKSAPVLVTLASTYSPPIGLVLKSTGILSKVADFLKTENLDKTVTNMYHSLDKIKQDKTLAEIQITSNKVIEIAKQISSPSLANNLISISRSIEKFNLKFDTAIETSEEISKNVSSKKLLTIVADYAQTYIPSSEREINEKLATVKSSVLENLEKNGVPKAVIMEVTEVMDQNIEKAKLEMKKCLNKEDKIIDKIGHVLIAADILNQTESHIISIGKKTPSHTTALKKCTQQLKLEVNNKVRGDVSKIAKEMTSDSPAKEFAKKILGINLANEILIKRALPAKSLGRSPL